MKILMISVALGMMLSHLALAAGDGVVVNRYKLNTGCDTANGFKENFIAGYAGTGIVKWSCLKWEKAKKTVKETVPLAMSCPNGLKLFQAGDDGSLNFRRIMDSGIVRANEDFCFNPTNVTQTFVALRPQCVAPSSVNMSDGKAADKVVATYKVVSGEGNDTCKLTLFRNPVPGHWLSGGASPQLIKDGEEQAAAPPAVEPPPPPPPPCNPEDC